MPGDLKNSVMKNSFSLSSLPPSSNCLETPEHVRLRERPYNSLTKKPRKSEEKENWRNSWDSQNGKIGTNFHENYDYLMSTFLIDSCKSITDEEQRKTAYRKNPNQSNYLVQLMPENLFFIESNVKTLNLLECLKKRQHKQSFHANCLDLFLNIDHDVRALSYCIDCIEKKIHPVSFVSRLKKEDLTKEELHKRKRAHENTHQELEAVGRQIRAKKSIIQNFSFTNNVSSTRNEKLHSLNPTYKLIKKLENRWLNLYLKSIEWDLTIEGLLENSPCRRKKLINKFDSSCCSDSSDEPVTKHRRLSNLEKNQSGLSYDNSCSEASIESDHLLMDTSVPPEDNRPSQSILTSNVSMISDYAPKMIDSSTQSVQDNSFKSKFSDSEERRPYSFDESAFTKDPSIFNNSDRSAHNLATIYLKHEDTDPEDRSQKNLSENGLKSSENELKTSDMSSEEDSTWKYGTRTPSDRKESYKHSSGSCTEFSDKNSIKTPNYDPHRPIIKKLVNDAELLVSPVRTLVSSERLSYHGKRVKHRSIGHSHEIGSKSKLQTEDNIADSCDASGEATTDDETSHPFCSVDNLRKSDDLDSTFTELQPMIALRNKISNRSYERPWSMSFPNQSTSQILNHSFSNSESALNQMLNVSVNSVKTESSMNSSSTIEETSQHNDKYNFSNGSLRRQKRLKPRRMMGRKSGSGSADNLSRGNKCQINKTFVISPQLYKSGSFSGSSSRRHSFSTEKSVLSDTRTLNNTSDAEMEEELISSSSDVCCNILQEDSAEEKKKCDERKKTSKKKIAQAPNFKIGKGTSFFSSTKVRADLTTSGAEEQTSSVCTIPDEAWDNYQEKYNSEAYSEDPPDSELLSKTLHFGEDYESYIDNSSDFSLNSVLRYKDEEDMDIESEEDVERFISKCKSTLQNFESETHSLHFSKKIRVCRDTIRKLRIVTEKSDNFDLLVEIKDITSKYENLEANISRESAVMELTEEVGAFRKELAALNTRITDIEKHKVSEHNELKEKIRELQEKKDKLSRVTKSLTISANSLTEEGDSLYKECLAALNKLEETLKCFLKRSDTWQQLESDLTKFQTDLQTEVEKLTKELGQPGDLIQELMCREFSSIQGSSTFHDEFFKVFNEKQNDGLKQMQNVHIYSMAMPSCEGSDSGISDSEHDCERDRKLSDLRQQQKDLESILTTHRKTEFAEKIYEIEQHLRNLRNLQKARKVFHSTLLPQSEASGKKDTQFKDEPWNICRNRKERSPLLDAVPSTSNISPVSTDDSEPEPHKSNSRLWRIVRAALPFHLAIIVIVCMAWLLDPRCCDQINNLNLSSSPQLKYLSGPPPT